MRINGNSGKSYWLQISKDFASPALSRMMKISLITLLKMFVCPSGREIVSLLRTGIATIYTNQPLAQYFCDNGGSSAPRKNFPIYKRVLVKECRWSFMTGALRNPPTSLEHPCHFMDSKPCCSSPSHKAPGAVGGTGDESTIQRRLDPSP